MGEMENVGNIEIEKYHIGFWNSKIYIDKYHIKNISLILIQPVQNQRYWKIKIQYFAIQNSVGVILR